MTQQRGLPKVINVQELKGRVDTHEAVCAERYGGINARLRRLEGWFVAMTGSVLGLMATIIIKGL